MTNVGGIVTENIPKTIAIGQAVYDKEDKKVGTVDMIYHDTGYFTVAVRPLPEKKDNPFEEKYLYVPFRLITNIDPRELFVSVTNDELRRDYANPPARFTAVADLGDAEVANTTQQSGYTGAPIVVDSVRIDELKGSITPGDHVYTTELTDLGTIKRYDPATGWMLVEKGVLSDKHDTMVPVTLVEDVNRDSHEVYLVTSQADLQRLQRLEPADVVFVEAKIHEGS